MNINRLISRFVMKKADHEENEALKQWKDESEENLQALRQLTQLNSMSDELHGYRETDAKAAWARLEPRLDKDKKTGTVRYLRYAAAAAAVLLVTFMAYRFINNGTSQEVEKGVYLATEVQKVTLKDGTLVTLDKGSRLSEDGTRRITLEGRAYFDVVHDTERPFFVKLAHGSVTVLGTEFNISTSTDYTEVFVTEGRVRYSYDNNNMILNKGDFIEVRKGALKTLKPAYAPEAWTSTTLKFENQNLMSVMQQVASYYDYRLETSEGLPGDNCRINTTFTNEKLEDVLQEIQVLTSLVYEIKGKTIIVRSFKC